MASGRAQRKGDDVSALKVAYEHHAPGLYDFGRWLLGRADSAEDAVHAVLIAALGRPGLLWDPHKLRAWLYAAIRNECLRIRRRDLPDAPPNEADLEVLELALRHRLGPDEIAVVLGLPVRVVQRTLVQNQEMLTDRSRTAEPISPAPTALYGRVLESARIPDRVGYFTERAQPYTRAGYPSPLDRPASRRLLPLALGVVAVAIIALLIGFVTWDQPPPKSAARVPEPSVVLTDVPLEPFSPPPSPTRTPSPSNSPTPSPTASPSPTPTSPSPSQDRRAPGVRIVTAGEDCDRRGWSMRVAVLTSGPATRSASVTWSADGSSATVTAVRVDATTYSAQLNGLPQRTQVSFHGTAVSVAGKAGQSATSSRSVNCGGRPRR